MKPATVEKYLAAVAAMQAFRVAFLENEPAPTKDEFELLADEYHDLSRDLNNGYDDIQNSVIIMDIYDGRIAEEEDQEGPQQVT